MNRALLGIFTVALCFAVGQNLECYKCDIGFWDLCITTQKICSDGQQCYSGVGTAAGVISVKMKGCLSLAECNRTTDMEFGLNKTMYQMTKICCSTDLCNAAPGLHTLSLVLFSLISVFIAKVLV